jgi:protein-tyrosine phosphatase
VLFDYDEIIPGQLCVGTFVRPDDVSHLEDIGITCIVSLQTDDDLAACGVSLADVLRACRDAGIEHRRVSTPDFDRAALAAKLPLCVAELEAAITPKSARVYLHCTAGINRSPTTAAAFLIRSRGYTAPQAYEYVVSRRDCKPYLEVLERYERVVKGNL